MGDAAVAASVLAAAPVGDAALRDVRVGQVANVGFVGFVGVVRATVAVAYVGGPSANGVAPTLAVEGGSTGAAVEYVVAVCDTALGSVVGAYLVVRAAVAF